MWGWLWIQADRVTEKYFKFLSSVFPAHSY
nr:MAG TPA_asm: hypothetical protein [Caudoviricetes sp.]